MIFPEIVLLDTLRNALKFVRTDYTQQSDKTKTYLYQLMNGPKLERYDMFEEAKSVICGPKDSPKTFSIDIMFNLKRDGAPTAHITLPAEQQAPQNSFGMGLGSEDYIIDDGDAANNIPGSFQEVFVRKMQATYDIVITSANPNEVIMLYHFIRGLLIACYFTLNEKSLHNITFSGQDVQPYSDIFPDVYMRAVRVTLYYDTSVPSMYKELQAHDVNVNGVAVVD